MTKDKIKNLIDFIPLIILTVYTIILIWTVSTTTIIFSYEHYIGLVMLAVTYILFVWQHKPGVLALGFTLTLGLFKVVSYSAIISYYSIGGSLNGHSSCDIKIQGIFLLWLAIHLTISGRHYVGILSNKYWRDLFDTFKHGQMKPLSET
jgi:hypothetical protein